MGISPASTRRCRRSSHSLCRSSSCAQCQDRAIFIASPSGSGERKSKHFCGLVRCALAVGCERGRGVNLELSEHCGKVRGGGGCRDRSRTKDGSRGIESLQSGEVDDRDGGTSGVLLRKWDRGVSNGSDGIFVCELVVAIGGHRRGCVLIQELRASKS
jgi:hypothetical protein